MSGTDVAYAAMRCPVLTERMLLPAKEYVHSQGDMIVLYGNQVNSATSLRACYVVPGTDVAYCASPVLTDSEHMVLLSAYARA
eukprot:749032-Rhodomonas_salina.2